MVSGEVKYQVRDPTLNIFRFKHFLEREISISRLSYFLFRFFSPALHCQDQHQYRRHLHTQSNYDESVLPSATWRGDNGVSAKTKALKGKRWEQRGDI